MSSLAQARYTPEQYLEIDRKADHRSEYVNGEILAMAGASREHNLIVTNLVRELSLSLRGRPCETYSNDMRVEVSSTRYAYPDVVVACGQPEFKEGQLDTLKNPTVVLEVLSPTTAADDRSWKFAHYRRLETLTDYVMLSQFQPFIEHYMRRDNQWMLTEVVGIEAVLRLPSIGCDLPLSAIYERVEFAPDPEMPALELWGHTMRGSGPDA
jgi:Uma2 family endonuclease